jgi:hypothetical protein
MLIEETPTTDQEVNTKPPQIHKPAPIFLHGVIHCDKMISNINEVAETEQFYTKSMANNVVKITCLTPETYRALIKHLKETDVYYHTYQLKEERAFRVVLKYLHHTTKIEDIRQDLLQQGHVARNIVNAHHRISKEPLNLFFVVLNQPRTTKKFTKLRPYKIKSYTLNHLEQINTTSRSTHAVNNMGIREATATGHTRASNAVANIIVQNARKVGKPPQNAPFVAETTRPTIKDATIIKISLVVETLTETPKPWKPHSTRWKLLTASLSKAPHNNPNNCAPTRT